MRGRGAITLSNGFLLCFSAVSACKRQSAGKETNSEPNKMGISRKNLLSERSELDFQNIERIYLLQEVKFGKSLSLVGASEDVQAISMISMIAAPIAGGLLGSRLGASKPKQPKTKDGLQPPISPNSPAVLRHQKPAEAVQFKDNPVNTAVSPKKRVKIEQVDIPRDPALLPSSSFPNKLAKPKVNPLMVTGEDGKVFYKVKRNELFGQRASGEIKVVPINELKEMSLPKIQGVHSSRV